MAKFLQSRAAGLSGDEILDQNVLTVAGLRCLISGDFYLVPCGEDFLLLHEKGIFLIHQCHKTGMILGQLPADQWTDLNYLGHERKFPNPIRENQQVISWLTHILKLPQDHFCGIVVFDTQCELRQVPADGAGYRILRVDQLEEFFAQLPQRPVRYAHSQLEALNDIFLLVTGGEA